MAERELAERISAIREPAARWRRLPEKVREQVRQMLVAGANNPWIAIVGITQEQMIDGVATVGAMLEQAEEG